MDTHRGRRRLLALAIAVMAVSPHGVPARAAASAVNEVGTAFQPAEVRIGVNDRVVWTNRSNQSHTVTFPDQDLHPRCDPGAPALLRVGCQGAGATAERVFPSPGTYSYYCKLHQNVDPPMRGVVVVGAATTTLATTSSTLPGKSSSTTATTLRATSSTTTTTRPLATSSTVTTLPTTTATTTEATTVLLPGEPPPFTDDTSTAANKSRGSKDGSDSSTVALIVGLLLAVSAAGGFLLWRLRPGRP
jgi:plastocyanin